MGRPKGSKDLTKRKQKTFISGPTERSIVKDCEKKLGLKEKHPGIVTARISKLRKERAQRKA